MMQIAQGVVDDPELLEAHRTVRGLLAATAPKATAPKASKSKPSEPEPQPEAPGTRLGSRPSSSIRAGRA